MPRRTVPEGIRITRVGVWYIVLTLLVAVPAANTGNNALYLVEAALAFRLATRGGWIGRRLLEASGPAGSGSALVASAGSLALVVAGSGAAAGCAAGVAGSPAPLLSAATPTRADTASAAAIAAPISTPRLPRRERPDSGDLVAAPRVPSPPSRRDAVGGSDERDSEVPGYEPLIPAHE